MKRRVMSLLILLPIIGLLLYPQLGLGSYKTIGKAITEGVSYEVKEIIRTQKIGETDETGQITAIAYTVEPDKENFPSADFEGLGIAFLDGNDQEGWKFLQPTSWGHYDNDHLVMQTDVIRVDTEQGERLLVANINFGAIYNPAINQIVYNTKDDLTFRGAQIIEHQGDRFVIIKGKLNEYKGLSENGKEISVQGG